MGESKYEVTGDPQFIGHLTQQNFGPKIGVSTGQHYRAACDRQIGVRESKYEVTGDPLLRGHVIQPNFGPKIGSKRP